MLVLLMAPAGPVEAHDATVPALALADSGVKLVRAYALQPGEVLALDGRLDDAVGARIEPISDFRMQEPVAGGAPTGRTEFRSAHDADSLYIGAMMFDSDPAGIKGFQRRRDQLLATDDRFMWVLNTYRDQRNAYFFQISPLGHMGDGLLRTGQGTSVNKAWNGIWRAWDSSGFSHPGTPCSSCTSTTGAIQLTSGG